ncbi:hypothetical protein BV25DRAFT_1249477 [Artomyces pyxidatus]|uniref:Uncharacterized protein n=1 Tax=Artomyces pyxidatus TaxID=48021 RepID=A0ACB8TEI0_9AGAM|nr:hypothetical protein BV25DRAFT_1249477 [Artomyces pyxidatus]
MRPRPTAARPSRRGSAVFALRWLCARLCPRQLCHLDGLFVREVSPLAATLARLEHHCLRNLMRLPQIVIPFFCIPSFRGASGVLVLRMDFYEYGNMFLSPFSTAKVSDYFLTCRGSIVVSQATLSPPCRVRVKRCAKRSSLALSLATSSRPDLHLEAPA